jgi:SurA-like N-terminal domain
MDEWRRRVRLQRAQIILGVEDLAEAVGQDVGQVQQFAGQQLLLLTQESERLGQAVLDQLIDEVLIRQEADARGIFISEADIQNEIEESFGFFGGASPTEQPTATETMAPTPSLTPIPTAVITEIVPTNTPFPTFTPGPTNTPFPTSTPVSREAFEEILKETSDRLEDLGIPEDSLREIVEAQLYQELLLKELVLEQELPTEDLHASFFYLQFNSQEEADDALEEIESDGYEAFWNKIRSEPPDPDDDSSAVASEVIWRTQENVNALLDEVVGDTVFDTPINEASIVIVVPAITEEEEDTYYIILVTGKEIKPLSESAIQNAEQELLSGWLQSKRGAGVESFNRWLANIPTLPAIDARFLVPPTPTPFVALDPTPDLDIGGE